MCRIRSKRIIELLYWFELDITDHKIVKRIDEPYSSVHRFLMRVREAIQVYEDRFVHPLDGEVEVDETCFGASFKNRRRSKREELRKSGQVKRGRGANALQQAVFGIYERTDGLIYVEPVEAVTKETLQDIIDDRISIETTIYSDTGTVIRGFMRLLKIMKQLIITNMNTAEAQPALMGSKASGPMQKNESSDPMALVQVIWFII